jgi:serine O-acetyltransferase
MTVHGDCCLRIRQLLAADVAANIDRPTATAKDVLVGLAWSRGVQATVLHRLAHACWRRGLTPLSEVLLRVSQLIFGVDISYRACVGPGLVLRHCNGVVVGNGATLGSEVRVFQGVTVGNRLSGSADRPDGMPTIEDGVLLGAGCVVLGPVTVGAGAKIGANAVVTRDVPSGAVVSAARSTVNPP